MGFVVAVVRFVVVLAAGGWVMVVVTVVITIMLIVGGWRIGFICGGGSVASGGM